MIYNSDPICSKYAEQITDIFSKFVHVSDEVTITHEDDVALQDLWAAGKISKDGTFTIPCDLIKTGMAPMPNVRVVVDERGYCTDGVVVKFEVLWLEKPDIDFGEAFTWDKLYTVGCMKLKFDGEEFLCPIYLRVGDDAFVLGDEIITDKKLFTFDRRNTYAYENDLEMKMRWGSFLSTWYGIQIALLHPQIKTCFRGMERSETSKNAKGMKGAKRSTKYIRKIYVQRGAIAKRIESHKERHTLVWYVIGHWRHYQDGKISFVKGHWKGPLREAKRNLDAGRTRVIDTAVSA